MDLPDLRRLRYFIAVAEELHFGRAAHRLNLSQPPLSVQIRTLEREVGTPLLVRSQRRVSLTEPGRVLLEEARRLLSQASATIVRTRRAASGEVGQLAIGFISTVDYSFLPHLVRQFRQRFSGVALTLRELTADRQQALLLAGELDIGFSVLPSAAPELVLRPVFREPLIAAVPASHRLARGRRRVAMRALADDDFILFPRVLAQGLYDLVIDACQRAGFTPRIAQEAVQMQTILGLVAAGLGVALVPACMAKLGRPDVKYLALDRRGTVVETSARWRADNISPALGSLLSMMPAPHAHTSRARAISEVCAPRAPRARVP
jgi:DNA-binding transcriptional LysR family regulator